MSPGDRGVSRRKLLAGAGLLGYGVLTSYADVPIRSRQRLLAMIDPAARVVGGYTAYTLDWKEYVGTVGLVDPVAGLESRGYESNPLSAAKYHPKTGDLDDESLRRVDPEAPRWQWHVHLWDGDERAQLFSHYEYRPDLRRIGDEGITDVRQRIREHYDAKWDSRYPPGEANYFLGTACERVQAFVEAGTPRSTSG